MCTVSVLISVTAALLMTHRSRLKADKTSSSLITCSCIWLLQPCYRSEDCDVRTQHVDTALRVGHVSIIDVINAASWHSALAVSASPALVTETWFQHSQCLVQQRLRTNTSRQLLLCTRHHRWSSRVFSGRVHSTCPCRVRSVGACGGRPAFRETFQGRGQVCFPCDAVPACSR